MITENNNLEFKRELTDSIVKEIIAFCNTNGGTIILGYDDNGKSCMTKIWKFII